VLKKRVDCEMNEIFGKLILFSHPQYMMFGVGDFVLARGSCCSNSLLFGEVRRGGAGGVKTANKR